MSSEVVAPQSEMPAEQGLTKEFRDSDTYRKYRSDILARGIEEMWVDQIIFWYISRPDMFETEAGKKMMAEFDARVAESKKATEGQPNRQVEEDAKRFAAKFSNYMISEDDVEKADDEPPSPTPVCDHGHHGDCECESVCELSGVHTPGPSDGGPATATTTTSVPTSSASASTTSGKDDFPGFTRPNERDL
jgi:hypothetical protein